MPGAGFSSGGTGPAGFDPVGAASGRLPPYGPLAALYQLQTKSTPLNADGRLATIHPIDQRVALLIGVPVGTFRSAPLVGNGFSHLHSYDPALQRKVSDNVKTVLAPLLAAGDIVLLRVVGSSSLPGRLEVSITYRNMRTQKVQTL